MASQQGDYVVLVQPTDSGWRVKNINTKAETDLDLQKDMTTMRFIGDLESEEAEGVHVTFQGVSRFCAKDDYKTKAEDACPVTCGTC